MRAFRTECVSAQFDDSGASVGAPELQLDTAVGEGQGTGTELLGKILRGSASHVGGAEVQELGGATGPMTLPFDKGADGFD